MEAEKILNEIAEEQGWNTDSKLEHLLRYIENQQSNAAFRSFLLDAAYQETNMV